MTSDTQSVTISELKASTRYTVDVQAWTKVGAGLRTEGRFESGVPPGSAVSTSFVRSFELGASCDFESSGNCNTDFIFRETGECFTK